MRAEHARDHGGGKAVAISLFQKCTSPPADTPAWLEAAVSLATLYLNTDRMTEALDLYPLIMTTARTTLDPCTCAIVHGNWALAVLRGPLVNKDSALRHLDSAVGLLQCQPTDVYGELTAHVESERTKAEAWLIEYDAVKAAKDVCLAPRLASTITASRPNSIVAWKLLCEDSALCSFALVEADTNHGSARSVGITCGPYRVSCSGQRSFTPDVSTVIDGVTMRRRVPSTKASSRVRTK